MSANYWDLKKASMGLAAAGFMAALCGVGTVAYADNGLVRTSNEVQTSASEPKDSGDNASAAVQQPKKEGEKAASGAGATKEQSASQIKDTGKTKRVAKPKPKKKPVVKKIPNGWYKKGKSIFYYRNNKKVASRWIVTGDKPKTKHKEHGAKRRYWVSGKGKLMMNGFFKAKGKKYYAGKSGAVFTNGMKKIKGKYYTAAKKGALKRISKTQYRMVKRAKNRSSRTKYLVMVDTKKTHVGVFQGRKGHWKLKKYWLCSVGKKSTPTPKGTFHIYMRGYSFGSGFTCYYYSAFYGGYMLHSQTYYQGTFRIKGGRLGKHCTHGCVRLDLKNAKWAYYHLPKGTTVHAY
jgi:lipoprotein-anchoring transpeptidase ErfK/SrfK